MPHIIESSRIAGLSLLLCLSISLSVAADDLEREFDVKPGGKLAVFSDTGSIDVETWDQNVVRVIVENGEGRYSSDELELRVEQSGNNVIVKADVNGSGVFGFFGSNRGVKISFLITVPRQYDVDLNTGGGAIKIDDITGEVKADTSGGSIKVGDVTGGSVNVDTSGGSIRIGNVEGDVVAETSGGSIRVGDVGGSCEVDTSGGTIRIGMVQGPLEADTSGGSIKLEGSEVSVKADTSGGSIKVNRSGGPVEVSISGGSIVIDDAAGYIEAETAGGSIKATLRPTSDDSHVNLNSQGGDITIIIPSDHAATVSADLRITRRSRGDYRIYTDFPLTIQDEDERRIIGRGDINGGGDAIKLTTSNGDISILSLDN